MCIGNSFCLFVFEIFYIMTSNSEKNKRVRAPNFSEEEKSIILPCISKEKDIIECKKIDKFSNRDKNSAWERIALNFNTHLGANKVSTYMNYTTDIDKQGILYYIPTCLV